MRTAHVEFDRHACETLRLNRPDWNVAEGDVRDFSAKEFKGSDLFLSGLTTLDADTAKALVELKRSKLYCNALGSSVKIRAI